MRRSSSLDTTRRIVVGAVVILVAIAAIAVWRAWTVRGDQEDDLRTDIAEAAVAAAAVVEAYLRTEAETLAVVASSTAVLDTDVATMREEFARADPVGGEAGGGFAWVDAAGLLQVLVALPEDQLPIDVNDRNYVTQTLATGEPQVSDLVLSTGGVPVVAVTVPTFDRAGGVSGLVLRAQRLDADNALLQALAGAADFRLVDRDSALLLDDGPIEAGAATPAPEPGRFAASAPVGSTGWTIVVDPDPAERLGAAQRTLLIELLSIAVALAACVAAVWLAYRRIVAVTALNDRLTRASSRAETLQRLTADMANADDPAEIGRIAAAALPAATGSVAVLVGVLDGDQVHFVTMAGYPDVVTDAWTRLPLDTPSAITDCANRRTTLCFDARDDYLTQYPASGTLADLMQTEAVYTQPLVVEDEVIGVLGLTWTDRRVFSPDERRFLDTVARIVAQNLERARRYDDEHQIVEAMQRSVMPAALPTVPSFDIAARYLPASRGSIGGDWYDVAAVRDGSVAITVGDVVGHGPAAAADMAQLRNGLRALLAAGHRPADAFDHLDGLTRTTSGRFATAMLLHVDGIDGRIELVNAGHPPAVVVRGNGEVETAVSPLGPPLGFATQSRSSAELRLAPGDHVVMYTDGLIERRTEPIDAGLARLCAALRQVAEPDPERLCAAALELVGPVQRDDVCVLVARSTALAR